MTAKQTLKNFVTRVTEAIGNSEAEDLSLLYELFFR